MEHSEFETLLDAKLEPIKDTIIRLEKVNERMVEVLSTIARQEERVNGLRQDVEKCNHVHNLIFDRIQTIEKDHSTKVWAALMVFVGAITSGVIGMILGKR